jgi:hypothetical protein
MFSVAELQVAAKLLLQHRKSCLTPAFDDIVSFFLFLDWNMSEMDATFYKSNEVVEASRWVPSKGEGFHSGLWRLVA